MAEQYDVISTELVLEALAPTLTREMVQVTARAKPSGVVYYARLHPDAIEHLQDVVILRDRAIYMNIVSGWPDVAEVAMFTDLTAANEFVDMLTVTVQGVTDAVTWPLPPIQFPTNINALKTRVEAAAAELRGL